MRKVSPSGIRATAALLASAMASCVSHGPRYPELIADAGPPPEGRARIVLLRPDQRFDNYSMSRALIDVDGREFGKLAYGGFLYVDVKDEARIETSGRNRWAAGCVVRVRAKPGDTIYLDVEPRPVGAGDFVGAAVAAAIPAGDVSTVGDVFTEAAASGAIGAVVGAATEAVVYDKPCSGPFRLKPLAPDEAKKLLERLYWSG